VPSCAASKRSNSGARRAWPVLLGAAVALLAPAAAHASVEISAQRVLITAPDARATVERHPFRLSVQRGSGATVLREVANSGPPPLLEPASPDPVAPGFDDGTTPTLYAPLAFTVGRETLQQYPAGLFGGNLLSGERSGVQYAARDVLSAERTGSGARMTLSTSDPSGRRLIVTVAPQGPAAIRVSVRPDRADGVALMGESFASGPDEGFFGFGGRHNAIDQRGNAFSSFVEEQNTNGLQAPGRGGGGLSLFPNGPAAAYYPQAELFSSRPYGLFLDSFALSRFKLDSDRPDAWNLTTSAPALDYVVAPGRAPVAIATLTRITGRQRVPPDWAVGPMLDRLNRNFGETQQAYEANLRADLRDIRRYRLPLTAYRIEGWADPAGRGNGSALALPAFTSPAVLREVVAELRRRAIHPLFYFRPWVKPDSAAAKAGFVAKGEDGRPALTAGSGGQPIALIDFTNPRAVRFWREQVRQALDLGADGFMQDFGEQVLFGMRFADGETGVSMHNRYLNLFSRATRQELDAYGRAHPRRKLWFFTRAGYSGRPGSAAYEGGNFPGDETTDYTRSSGLASLAPDMLSRGVGGAYGFGTDIGGYFDYTSPPTTKELFLRWAEWAALSPVFRLHGSGRSGTHTPWSYDAETVRLYNGLSRLHLRARPLILALWRRAARTGIPVTRPLWLQYPTDPRARKEEQEWLLGPDVLVAPVVAEGARSRTVYFPRGCWRAPDGGERHEGPRASTVAAPLARLPYFFRCGTDPFRLRPAARPRRSPPRPRFTG